MTFRAQGLVLHVVEGLTIVTDLDLGWHVHLVARVRPSEIVAKPPHHRALKRAQQLLTGARIIVESEGLVDGLTYARILYAPLQEPRGEQGSFAAAMVAAGVAVYA